MPVDVSHITNICWRVIKWFCPLRWL